MSDFLDELDDEPNWDPEEHERVYLRDFRTGDLGWMVRRDHVDCVRLDRPQEIVRPFVPTDWTPCADPYPISKTQAVMVAFEADKKLCFFLGLHELARRDWTKLTDEQKQAWVSKGPEAPARRVSAYRQILAVLGHEPGRRA